MINAAVMGASGYAGQELIRLLAQHPDAKLKAVTSQSFGGEDLTDIYPHLRGQVDINCSESDIEKVADSCDVVFLALPPGIAPKLITKATLKKTKIIDLGAGFRLKDVPTYEKWYQTKHENPELVSEAVYGLTEWNEQAIKEAHLIANPGCYATASALALLPLVKSEVIKLDSLIVDAKSGVSGAGRTPTQAIHFNECNETIKAYGIATHRHTPEIEQQLSEHLKDGSQIKITFTPHLVPMNRGILVTAYGTLTKQTSIEDIYAIFKSYYQNKPFIRLYSPGKLAKGLPETRWVKGSNYCDIGYAIDERTQRLIVVAALDNLVKGAAGQAIQNMNVMHGLDQTRGLNQIPLFPA